MHQLVDLRAKDWAKVPNEPGVYWWYFPADCLARFRITEICGEGTLNLMRSPEGKVCLYHGMTTSLAHRIEWHAAQKLTQGALSSGFLSTFRFTLLALNEFDYAAGNFEIDLFMDGLDVVWQSATSVAEARTLEREELGGATHYPLNIQNNHHSDLAVFTQHLKRVRRDYKRRYIKG